MCKTHEGCWHVSLYILGYYCCLVLLQVCSKYQTHEESITEKMNVLHKKYTLANMRVAKEVGRRCAPRLSGRASFVRPSHVKRRLWGQSARHTPHGQIKCKSTLKCQRDLPLRRHALQKSSSSKGLHDANPHARIHDRIASRWYSCLLFCTQYEALLC